MKKAFLGIAAVSILVVLVLLVVKVTGSTREAVETTEVKTECCTKVPATSCCDSDSKAEGTATAGYEKTDCDKSKTECDKTETASAVTATAVKKECSPATCAGH